MNVGILVTLRVFPHRPWVHFLPKSMFLLVTVTCPFLRLNELLHFCRSIPLTRVYSDLSNSLRSSLSRRIRSSTPIKEYLYPLVTFLNSCTHCPRSVKTTKQKISVSTDLSPKILPFLPSRLCLIFRRHKKIRLSTITEPSPTTIFIRLHLSNTYINPPY